MALSRKYSVALSVLLLVLVAVTATVAARPPPQPLCDICSDDVLNGSEITSATVTIEIDEHGNGHWTAQLDLRANASVEPRAVQSAAEDALRGHRGEAQPRNLSVAVTEDTAVLTYDVPRMGHRSAGDLVVVDYFHSQGESGRWYGINVDRVVVTGPEGTTLVRAPPEHRLNGSALALAGTYGDTFDHTISPGWYLTFAGADGLVAQAASHLGIGIDIAQLKGDELPGTVLLPTAVLAAFLGVLSSRGRPLADRSPSRRLRAVAGLTVGLAIAAFLLAILVNWLTTGTVLLRGDVLLFGLLLAVPLVAAPFGLSLACVAAEYALVSDRFDIGVDTRWIVRYGIGIAALILAVGPFAAGTFGWLSTLYGSVVCVLVPTLFAPLALADRRGTRWLLAATILASPLLISVGWAPYGYYGAVYAPVFTASWALVTGALGTIAYTFSLSRRASRSVAFAQ